MNPKVIKILIVATVILQLSLAVAEEPASSTESLSSKVKTAIVNRDNTLMNSLYCWDDVSADMKAQLLADNADLFGAKPIAVTVVPKQADFAQEFTAQGVQYIFNLSVLGMIQVQSTNADGSDNSTAIPYGKKGGNFYFAVPVKKNPQAEPVKQNSFSIVVTTPKSPSSDLPHLEGAYVYMDGQIEVKRNLHGEGSLSETFWGNKLESCKVQSSSTNGLIRMMIEKDDQVIYDVESTNTMEPMTYKNQN